MSEETNQLTIEQEAAIQLNSGEFVTVEELHQEFERMREWCAACCGEDVAKLGGLPLER